MELLKVVAAFAVILVLLNKKFSLYTGMLAGTAVLVALFRIPLPEFLTIAWKSVTSWSTLQVVIAFYVIAILQFCLKERQHLAHAQRAMNGLFRDNRINAALASVFIGMLPAAPAVKLCGDIIDDMSGEHLTAPEKAAVSGFYRHIPEGVLPTYTQILIACSLSGVAVSSFVVTIFPMSVVLFFIGFLIYLRKVPLPKDQPRSNSRKDNVKVLFRSLWTIFAAIVIIIVFDLPAWLTVSGIVVLNFFVDKFSPADIVTALTKSLPLKMTLGSFAVFIFKDVLMATGVVELLPGYFAKLPIPSFMTMALLFFIGTLVASSNAITSAFIPLAFSTIPNANVSLLVLLMGYSYAASQISPVHICVSIAAEHFNVSLGEFIRKMLPMVTTYAVILLGYYLLLSSFGF